jgi:CRP-like cAMP-binding protein
VRHLALFSELTEEDFSRIHTPIDDLSFSVGTTIYEQGEISQAVFTVRSGLVKLVHYLANGAQRIVRVHRQGDAIGLEATLDETYHHHAVALQPTMVCKIPVEVLTQLDSQTPRLHQQLMRQWHHTVVQADEFLTTLAIGPLRRRMARLLLYLISEEDKEVCRFVRREEAAAILGTTTETASRIVAELRREGVIARVSSNCFRCDLGRLRAVAEN